MATDPDLPITDEEDNPVATATWTPEPEPDTTSPVGSLATVEPQGPSLLEKRAKIREMVDARAKQVWDEKHPFTPSGWQPATPERVYREAEVRVHEVMADENQRRRQAAVEQKRAEVVARNEENAKRLRGFQAVRAATYVDPQTKLIEQKQDREGRLLHHPTGWEDLDEHPITKAPTKVMYDQYGQRQFKAPPIVASSNPLDENMYFLRKDNTQFETPAGTISELTQSPNYQIRKTALAAHKRKITEQFNNSLEESEGKASTAKEIVIAAEANLAALEDRANKLREQSTTTTDPVRQDGLAAAEQQTVQEHEAAKQQLKRLKFDAAHLGSTLSLQKRQKQIAIRTAQAHEIASEVMARGGNPETDPTYLANAKLAADEQAGLDADQKTLQTLQSAWIAANGPLKPNQITAGPTGATVDESLATGEPYVQKQRGIRSIGAVGIDEFSRRYGSGEGGFQPDSLLRLKTRSDAIQETLDNPNTQLNEKVRMSLGNERTFIDSLFKQRFARLDPATRQRVTDAIRDPTFYEKAREFEAGIRRGAGSALVDTGEFAARNLLRAVGNPAEAQAAVKDFADAMRETAGEWGAEVPPEVKKKLQDSFVTGSLPQGLGSTVAMFAPVGAVGRVGQLAGLSKGAISKLVTASIAVTGAMTEANAFRREAERYLAPELKKGKITEQEYWRGLGAAELFGLPLGATEAIPLSGMAKRVTMLPGGESWLRNLLGIAGRMGGARAAKWIAGPGKQALVDAIGGMTEEGLQEWGQAVGEDLYASKTFDPNREVGAGAAENAAVGGISGALFSVLASVIGARRRGPPGGQEGTTATLPPDTGVTPDEMGGLESAFGATTPPTPTAGAPAAAPTTPPVETPSPAQEAKVGPNADITPTPVNANIPPAAGETAGVPPAPGITPEAAPPPAAETLPAAAPAGKPTGEPTVPAVAVEPPKTAPATPVPAPISESATKPIPPTWRVAVFDGDTVQVDMVDENGVNAGSTSPNTLAEQGYDITPLQGLKFGSYTIGQLGAKKEAAPVASPVIAQTTTQPGEPNALQKQSPAEIPLRNEPEGSAGVRVENQVVQETSGTPAPAVAGEAAETVREEVAPAETPAQKKERYRKEFREATEQQRLDREERNAIQKRMNAEKLAAVKAQVEAKRQAKAEAQKPAAEQPVPPAEAKPVFRGKLEAGSTTEEGGTVVGNFDRKIDAEKAAESGGKVEPYLFGKYKRGWIVVAPKPAPESAPATAAAGKTVATEPKGIPEPPVVRTPNAPIETEETLAVKRVARESKQKAYEKMEDVRQKVNAATYGTKKREQLQKLLDQASDAYSKLRDAGSKAKEELYDAGLREDIADKNVPIERRWAASMELAKRHGIRTEELDRGYKLLKAEAERRLIEAGATKEEAASEALNLVSMLTSYPRVESYAFDQSVPVAMSSIARTQWRNRASEKLKELQDKYGISSTKDDRVLANAESESSANKHLVEIEQRLKADRAEEENKAAALAKAASDRMAAEEEKAAALEAQGKPAFWIHLPSGWFVAEKAVAVKIKGAEWATGLFANKGSDRQWRVTEPKTGMSIGTGPTRKEAIQEATKTLNTLGKDRFTTRVAEVEKKQGPRTKQKETPPATVPEAPTEIAPAAVPVTEKIATQTEIATEPNRAPVLVRIDNRIDALEEIQRKIENDEPTPELDALIQSAEATAKEKSDALGEIESRIESVESEQRLKGGKAQELIALNKQRDVAYDANEKAEKDLKQLNEEPLDFIDSVLGKLAQARERIQGKRLEAERSGLLKNAPYGTAPLTNAKGETVLRSLAEPEAAAQARTTVEEATKAVDAIRKDNPKAPEATFVHEPDWLENGHGVRGQYRDGKIVINTAFADDPASVFMHEWAHDTLAKPQGRTAIVTFATRELPKADLDALQAKYARQEGESVVDHRMRLVEEWVAKNAEKEPGVWQRIVERVKGWLERMGLAKLTNEEAARALLRVLRRGEATITEQGQPRFSLADEPKTDLSRVPISERARGLPAADIEYDVRAQAERKAEAAALVAKQGAVAAEGFIGDRSLPQDTRVAIGGNLLKQKQGELANAKTPDEVVRAIADINRITKATQSGVSTESGQGVAMHKAIWDELGAFKHVVDYTTHVREKQEAELGPKFPGDPTAEVKAGLGEAGNEAGVAIDNVAGAKPTEEPTGKNADSAKAWLAGHKSILRILRNVARDYDLKWADIFNNLPENQEARKAQLFATIKAMPKFQKLTEKQSTDFAKLLDGAWTYMRNQIFEREFRRLVKLENVKEADVKKVKSAVGDLIKFSNLGLLDNTTFLDAMAKKYNMEQLNGETAKKLTDLADKIQRAANPAEKARLQIEMMDAYHAAKGVTPVDFLTSLLYAHILSAPTTQIGGNLVPNLMKTVEQLAMSSILHPTKIGTLAKGYTESFPIGWKQAKSILATSHGGRDAAAVLAESKGDALELTAQGQVFPELQKKFPAGAKAIQGYSSAMRYVSRFMRAVDSTAFFPAREAFTRVKAELLLEGKYSGAELQRQVEKHLAISKADFASATTQAESEGFTETHAKNRRILEIVEERRGASKVGAQAMEEGTRFGESTTLTGEPEGWAGVGYKMVANAVSKFRPGGIPVLKVFLLFLRVPTNFFNATAAYTVLGLPSAFKGSIVTSAEKNNRHVRRQLSEDERNQLYVKSFIGTSLLAYFATRALTSGADDENGLGLTANGPQSPTARAQWRAKGNIPFSIRLPGTKTWFNYQNSPLAMPLSLSAFVADWARYENTADHRVTRAVTNALLRFPSVILGMPVMQGLMELAELTDPHRPNVSRSVSFFKNLGTNLVMPRLVQQVFQTMDSTMKTEGAIQYDSLGQPVQREAYTRFVSRETEDPLKLWLSKANIVVPSPARTLRIGSQSYQMTAEDYSDLRRRAGTLTRIMLNQRLPSIRAMKPDAAEKEIDGIAQKNILRVRDEMKRAGKLKPPPGVIVPVR